MLRVCLIGPGDLEYHYQELLGIPKEKFESELNHIAKALVESSVELVALPDRGVSFEVCKRYKQLGGRKAFATVPTSDTDFGVKHLQPFLESQVNVKKVFDEVIDTTSWYKQDLTHCIFGDVVLMLGNSLGSLGELMHGYYLYKLFVGAKPEVQVMRKKIHLQVRSGERFPFHTIVYNPFLKEKINFEIEHYIRKTGGALEYVNNPVELHRALEKLDSMAGG